MLGLAAMLESVLRLAHQTVLFELNSPNTGKCRKRISAFPQAQTRGCDPVQFVFSDNINMANSRALLTPPVTTSDVSVAQKAFSLASTPKALDSREITLDPSSLIYQGDRDARPCSLFPVEYLAEVWHRSSTLARHARGAQATGKQNKLSNPREVLCKQLKVRAHASQGSLKEYISPFRATACKTSRMAKSVNLMEMAAKNKLRLGPIPK
ncbi:hypothetical protein MHYP_G00114750 [Metynnis hypsauchen]